jgi:hypothetical protein
MSSTFTGPLRIFKRNNPTNNGTIAPDNTGAAVITQQVSFSGVNAAGAITTYGIGNAATTIDQVWVPAGSFISNIRLFETTAPSAFTGMVITVGLAVQNPTTGVITTTTIGTITPTTTGGVIAFTPTATAAAAALMANVGQLDAQITFTVGTTSGVTGTLAGVFDVSYTARNVDGSINPIGSGYTNS